MKNNQLLYVLYGAENTGKTSTLRYLAQKLDKVATLTSGRIECESDFSVTFKIKEKIVSIVTPGDNAEIIKEHLGLNDVPSSNIIICASRTRGQTTDFLWANYTEEQLRWVNKMYVYLDDEKHINACNRSVAHFLFESLLLELHTE